MVKAAVSALERVYSHLCQQEEHHVWLRAFPLPLSQVEGCPHDDEVLYEYQCWMRSMYGSCRDQLLCLLLHPNQSLAVSVRCALSELEVEGVRTLLHYNPSLSHEVLAALSCPRQLPCSC